MQSVLLLPKTLILALALPVAWSASVCSLRAQTFAAPLQATGASPVDFEFRADGTLIAKGATGTGSLLSTDQGAGTRLLWYPKLAAFRAGNVPANGTVWDEGNLGQGSVAFGLYTMASGSGSAAFGAGSMATGTNSFGAGHNAWATGYGSVALGEDATASGTVAMAFGYHSFATGYGSVAFGYAASATGDSSVSLGDASTASGPGAFATNYATLASGQNASAFGESSKAASYDALVLGRYNVGGGSATTWVATDPLFEVGNGTSQTHSDALVVYKNGSASFQGVVTVAPGGDIPMYTGN